MGSHLAMAWSQTCCSPVTQSIISVAPIAWLGPVEASKKSGWSMTIRISSSSVVLSFWIAVEISRSSPSKAEIPCPEKFSFWATPGSVLLDVLATPFPDGRFAGAGDRPGTAPGWDRSGSAVRASGGPPAAGVGIVLLVCLGVVKSSERPSTYANCCLPASRVRSRPWDIVSEFRYQWQRRG